MKKNNASIKIGGHRIEISNIDKIFFPKDKITKGDVVDYYAKIASWMVPYMKNRPISMLRYPDGINGEAFYQKEIGSYFPEWIKRQSVEKKEGGFTNYVVCNNKATLVYLATQACLTPHLWLSKIDELDYPDKIVFDLDPSGDDFGLVAKTAKKLKILLDHLKLKSFVMTTGSRGLHVIIPIKREFNFDEVRKFAASIARILIDHEPDNLTMEMSKSKRGERLFIDTLRNSFSATSVAPYAIRAKDGAPVATPLDWNELDDKSLKPTKYNINNIFKRLEAIEDPWKDYFKIKQSLKGTIKLLEKMYGFRRSSSR